MLATTPLLILIPPPHVSERKKNFLALHNNKACCLSSVFSGCDHSISEDSVLIEYSKVVQCAMCAMCAMCNVHAGPGLPIGEQPKYGEACNVLVVIATLTQAAMLWW